MEKKRCDWVKPGDEASRFYHDLEWGVPLHDDRALFELLVLEGAQAGLSWALILKRRQAYRKAFDNFNPKKVAAYSEKKIEELLQNEGIIRNRLKIEAAVINARCFLKIQNEFGSFDAYLWEFISHQPITNQWHTIKDVPCVSDIAALLSRDLSKRGFKFVGPKIIYSFMQAVGMVNDHLVSCYRHKEIVDTISSLG